MKRKTPVQAGALQADGREGGLLAKLLSPARGGKEFGDRLAPSNFAREEKKGRKKDFYAELRSRGITWLAEKEKKKREKRGAVRGIRKKGKEGGKSFPPVRLAFRRLRLIKRKVPRRDASSPNGGRKGRGGDGLHPQGSFNP